MKPAPFDYTRPADLPGALKALGGDGARALAGGQSLGPMLNLRLARPGLLVDLRRVDELRRIEQRGDALVLGAMTTHASIEDGQVPDTTRGMLRRVAADIAYRAVRTRGTMGGSLAHADPAADWVTALTALDATLTIARGGGTSTALMAGFMTGAFATALGDGAMLTAISIPSLSDRARWGYYKICRKPGEFADAIGAVVLDPARDYRRVVMGAVGGAPVVLESLAAKLPFDSTPTLTRAEIEAAAPAMDSVDRQLHVVAVERALAQAYAR
ncbi:MAG: FAD binding domain-containing protein [Rhodospirillales bacterium]|nr:FAD binding domain-containing protein [Rhodospirillales bacterium]